MPEASGSSRVSTTVAGGSRQRCATGLRCHAGAVGSSRSLHTAGLGNAACWDIAFFACVSAQLVRTLRHQATARVCDPNPCSRGGHIARVGLLSIGPGLDDSRLPLCRDPSSATLPLVQGPVKRHFAAHVELPVRLFPFVLWSDGSQLKIIGGVKFHNVNISPANWPLHLMRSKKGYRRLGMLPVVDPDLQ